MHKSSPMKSMYGLHKIQSAYPSEYRQTDLRKEFLEANNMISIKPEHFKDLLFQDTRQTKSQQLARRQSNIQLRGYKRSFLEHKNLLVQNKFDTNISDDNFSDSNKQSNVQDQNTSHNRQDFEPLKESKFLLAKCNDQDKWEFVEKDDQSMQSLMDQKSFGTTLAHKFKFIESVTADEKCIQKDKKIKIRIHIPQKEQICYNSQQTEQDQSQQQQIKINSLSHFYQKQKSQTLYNYKAIDHIQSLNNVLKFIQPSKENQQRINDVVVMRDRPTMRSKSTMDKRKKMGPLLKIKLDNSKNKNLQVFKDLFSPQLKKNSDIQPFVTSPLHNKAYFKSNNLSRKSSLVSISSNKFAFAPFMIAGESIKLGCF